MRTSCEHARERLSLQLDDELSAHEATLLERHLGRCGACAAFAFEVREYTQLLRAAPPEPAPTVWLHSPPAARRLAARVAAVTAAAAAAVLVAISTVPLGHSRNTATAPVGFGFWPTGLSGDRNLGVQHVALGLRTPSSPGGPRRGIHSA